MTEDDRSADVVTVASVLTTAALRLDLTIEQLRAEPLSERGRAALVSLEGLAEQLAELRPDLDRLAA